jgi:hypothetical protein
MSLDVAKSGKIGVKNRRVASAMQGGGSGVSSSLKFRKKSIKRD